MVDQSQSVEDWGNSVVSFNLNNRLVAWLIH